MKTLPTLPQTARETSSKSRATLDQADDKVTGETSRSPSMSPSVVLLRLLRFADSRLMKLATVLAPLTKLAKVLVPSILKLNRTNPSLTMISVSPVFSVFFKQIVKLSGAFLFLFLSRGLVDLLFIDRKGLLLK